MIKNDEFDSLKRNKVDKIDQNLAKFKIITNLLKVKNPQENRYFEQPTFLSSETSSIFFIKNWIL